jgi:hypothetical protein
LEVDSDNCTTVINNEIRLRNQFDLVDAEKMYQFHFIKNNFTVIENLTISVIINQNIVTKIKNGEKVDPVKINRNSISVFRSKVDPNVNNNWSQFVSKFNNNGDDIVYWIGPYDKEMYGAYACEM